VGKLPWVLNDKDGVPVGAFRTRALRRLVARYLRVVALGTLPGSGKGLGGAVEKYVWGKTGGTIHAVGREPAKFGFKVKRELGMMHCDRGAAKRLLADARRLVNDPKFKVALARECEKYIRGKGK